MSSKESVYSHIKKSGNLPTLPEILFTLLSACDDENTPLPEVANIISRDPGLSVKVLQLVNSAYHGFRHTFSSIEQAVIYLGANTIKNLAVTTSIHKVFQEKKFSDQTLLNPGDFWYHSLMTATIAKRLATHTKNCDPDEAYISGLLHDIGKVIFTSTFPDQYNKNIVTNQNPAEAVTKEREALGLHHGEAGSWLVRQWKLNSIIADAICYHHESVEQIREAFPLVKTIYLANVLSKSIEDPSQVEQAGEILLGLSYNDFQEVVEGAHEEVEKIAEEMQIKITPPLLPGSEQSEIESTSSATSLDSIADTNQVDSRSTDPGNTAVEEAIASRVKNISLLITLLEELVQAGDVDAILMAFEQCMTLLLDIDKVLFFLPDREDLLLQGTTSSTNPLGDISKGLTLPIKKSTSLLVKTYQQNNPAKTPLQSGVGENIADQQILSVLDCDVAQAIPLVVQDRVMGVVVFGIDLESQTDSEAEHKLILTVARQVALCLHLEETKQKREEELKAERLAALTMTAKKFAHEINNPLGIISNYLVTVKLKLEDDPAIQSDLGIIEEEITRISAMVEQMQRYSQTPLTNFEELNINEVVRDIVQLAKSSLFNQSGVSLSFVPASELPLITTSKDAIKQILINLVKNSSEAMSDGGRVIIRTRKLAEESANRSPGVELIVSDTGPGLPPSVMENLYKPFVTTKQSGHSGLGLSIVDKAVHDLGGKLFCSSTQGDGTAFTIQLPGA